MTSTLLSVCVCVPSQPVLRRNPRRFCGIAMASLLDKLLILTAFGCGHFLHRAPHQDYLDDLEREAGLDLFWWPRLDFKFSCSVVPGPGPSVTRVRMEGVQSFSGCSSAPWMLSDGCSCNTWRKSEHLWVVASPVQGFQLSSRGSEFRHDGLKSFLPSAPTPIPTWAWAKNG